MVAHRDIPYESKSGGINMREAQQQTFNFNMGSLVIKNNKLSPSQRLYGCTYYFAIKYFLLFKKKVYVSIYSTTTMYKSI